uniref:WD40 repeat domain-containing protein n=1 Tax=Streptomyces hawaiiensis TaxID=67305 RepID=UPI0031CECA96
MRARFSPDSGVLAVAGDEGTLQLWNTASRQKIGSPLPTPGDTVHALAFSPDGRRLYAAGDHTPLQSYDISPAGAVRTICQRVTNGLSPGQWQRHLPAVPYRRACP